MSPEQLLSRNNFFIFLSALLVLLFLFLNKPDLNVQASAQTIVDSCKNMERPDVCYEQSFTKIAKNNPLSDTLEVLSEVRKHEDSMNGCHSIAHAIAKEEVKKDPNSWELLLSRMPLSDCSGGFLMGTLEGHRLHNTSFVLNADSVQQTCQRLPAEQTCIHAMGHLLLAENNGVVDTTLSVCKNLLPENQYECFSGMFMENIYRRNISHHHGEKLFPWNEQTLKEQEMLCSTQRGLAGKGCYRELSHMYVVMSKHDTKEIYRACQKAPTQDYKDACYFHAVGVMALVSSEPSSSLVELCDPYKQTTKYERCKQAIINTID